MNSRTFNRRQFLTTILATSIAPAFVRAQAGKKLNVAIIGCGGRGAGNLAEIAGAGENIVALCDVNANNLAAAAKKYPEAKTFADFRKLYDELKDFDAVAVSTAEHTHALATLPALRMKKHVYCEKPLTHNVWECRKIREAAKAAGDAT